MKRVAADAGNLSMFDPFEVLGLERQYLLDLKVLEKHYFEAQKIAHPDRHALAEETVRKEALKTATAVNQAYLLLKDPLKRATFLLQAAGVELLQHHPQILAQTLEWRERVEAGEDLRPELNQLEGDLLEDMKKGFQTKDFEKVRECLYGLTYVQKILQEIKGRNYASSTG